MTNGAGVSQELFRRQVDAQWNVDMSNLVLHRKSSVIQIL